jgi:hypothetical protein
MNTATAMQATTPGLEDHLSAFVRDVNAHPSMAKLLKGWEPRLTIETLDADERFHLRVADCKVHTVAADGAADEHAILIRGEREVLCEVFTGISNPAQAYLEGTLEVFGDDRDHIKLDAICLVLWGI